VVGLQLQFRFDPDEVEMVEPLASLIAPLDPARA
jgi:hypothetical protein